MDPEALIDLLVEKGLGRDRASQTLVAEFEASGEELFDFLEASGLGCREEILTFIATEQGREFVDLDNVSLPSELVSAIEADILRIFECLPLEVSDTFTKVCIADPFDSVAVQELAAILGKRVEIAVADPQKIRTRLANLINRSTSGSAGTPIAASLGGGPIDGARIRRSQPVVSPTLLVALSVVALLSMAFTALYLNQNRRLDAWAALVKKSEALLRQSEASRKGVESAIIQMESDLGALEKLLTQKEVDAIRVDVFEKDLSELRGQMESLKKILAEVETRASENDESVPAEDQAP